MRKKPSLLRELISLKQASKISGYHPDYLSYLIRKGKIDGKRIGRDWFTTKEAVRTYLSTKKFLPVKDLLFSKVNPRAIIVVSIAAILIGMGAFLIFNPPAYFQQARGDFAQRTKLRTKNIGIYQSAGKEVGEVKVTTYSSDSTGGVEISIQPESALSGSKEKLSLFQRIKNLFEGLFK